uniref:Autophagy-related protein 13 n=1 Tax=Echinostoma caproni TaxID=27848 RepID=A0A183A0A1_9TREM
LNSASPLSKPENSSTTSSGVCLSVDSAPHTDTLGRSLTDLSSQFTSEPSLFGSFYSGTSPRIPDTESPLAEIELISLTANRPTPRYRLRVDPCTAFLGYNNRDFLGARRATRRLQSILPLSPRGLTTIPSEGKLNDLEVTNTSVSPDTLGKSGETDEDGNLDDDDDEEDDSLSLSSEQIERILDYFRELLMPVSSTFTLCRPHYYNIPYAVIITATCTSGKI